MKVFFCETYDDGTVGGSHACMYNMIRYMDRSKIEFIVGFYSQNTYVDRYRSLGVDVHILPFGKPFLHRNIFFRKAVNWYNLEFKAGRYLVKYFQEKRFDLVVLNNSVFASLLFIKVCKKIGLPVVVYERGIGYFKKAHTRATAYIQASIPISDSIQEFIIGYGFRTKIIQRIYDGIDPENVRPKRSIQEVKASLNIPENSRVVGIIGNVRPWKGQKYFVDAFGELSKKYDNLYGLVVGGWGAEDKAFQASLAEKVKERGQEGRLRFLGYRTDVPDLLSIFDVLVHASTKPEPFGMVILDAMAARRPVVATNSGGPVEILNHGECGILIPPKDVQAIEAACSRYLEDFDFSKKMVDKAYERLLQHFDQHKTVEQATELFHRVIHDYHERFPVEKSLDGSLD